MVFLKEKVSNKGISMIPRFRFAPSPTGGLHIGTARTALFNWLAARSMNGQLILRIEDTDIKRSDRSYETSIVGDLKWVGIDWDEFYRQSERVNIYRSYGERLLMEGKAYRCFCSPERLKNLSEKLISEGKMPKYDNRCRHLSDEEIDRRIKQGEKYALRFKVKNGEITFNDLIRGKIRFSSEVIGDFIIIKSDGTPSYNFAVVVDDAEMKVSHVLRGEDHITNTARQIILFESFGYKIPQYAHIPMILGKDGSKLSKRHGATNIYEFRKIGYLREAVANYLSLLSWSPREGQEIFDIKDIIGEFKISDISRSPAIFDMDKLNWINGIHIRKKSNDELTKLCIPYLVEDGILEDKDLKDKAINLKIRKCVEAFKDNLVVLSEFPDYARIFFIDKIESYSDDAIQILKVDTSRIVLEVLLSELKSELKSLSRKHPGRENYNLDEEESKKIINKVAARLKKDKIKGKNLYMPIRAALTGKTHGPELPRVVSILGIEDCIERIRQTFNFLKV